MLRTTALALVLASLVAVPATAQDYAEAVKWYRKAAEQGDVKAQSNLGVMYASGQGVKQDLVLAHM
jgi:TPR repeat protein